MTFTTYELAFPVALGIMFGLFRYTFHKKMDPQNAVRKAAMDAAIGIAGMAAISVFLKLVAPV